MRLLLGALSAAAAACLVIAVPQAAFAQAIERNLPPAQPSASTPLPAPNATPDSQDDKAIGPALKALVLLGGAEPVRDVSTAQGVDATGLPHLHGRRIEARLGRYLRRPISRKLIAQIEAEVARAYRRRGYPFVSLSTPPQTIGGGVLTIRVVEFTAGKVAVTGVPAPVADEVRSQVRLQPGEPVDAPRLSDDIDWINRNPFRRAQAIFSPGDALGRTDLDLQVTASRPWQVYAGWANSGSSGTRFDRYFLGGQAAADVLGMDAFASYQFTASNDFFDKDGDAFGETSHPRYLSHGLRTSLRFAPRQAIEASADYVETNVVTGLFQVRQRTAELSLGWRAALSTFAPLRGDVDLGVELKRIERQTFFQGFDVLDNAAEVYQLYGGWTYGWSDRGGRNLVTATVHLNPGGVNTRSDDARLDLFSAGRVTNSAYAYATVQATRTTRLPGRWTLSNTLILQYAGDALPETEQLALGGVDLVRGYTIDNGAFDSAVVLRNELRAPSRALLQPLTRIPDALSPYAFIDAAYGSSRRIGESARLASLGVGADYALGGHATLSATAAYRLADRVPEGDRSLVVQARATVTF